MADVDINPFGEHDKTDEPTSEIFLSPRRRIEKVNKKHHSKEKVKELNS